MDSPVFRFRGLKKVLIFRAFILLPAFVCAHAPGLAQNLGEAGLDQSAPYHVPESGVENPLIESPRRPEGELLAPLADISSLYSSESLVDMPYVYPLGRMRLAPEMRQVAP